MAIIDSQSTKWGNNKAPNDIEGNKMFAVVLIVILVYTLGYKPYKTCIK